MIKVEIKSIEDNITNDIEKKKKQLANVSKEAHTEFVALTPIDKGNARKSTTLQGNSITANYAYAERLDNGWSKQAPKGMTEPWEKWMDKKIQSILGK